MIIASQIYIVIVYKYTALLNTRIIFLYVYLVSGFLRAFACLRTAILLFAISRVARSGAALPSGAPAALALGAAEKCHCYLLLLICRRNENRRVSIRF